MQRAFAIEYLRSGDGTAAARQAGYRVPAVEACRLLAKPRVAHAIEVLRGAVEAASEADVVGPLTIQAIADAAEIQAFWSSIMRSPEEETRDRVKAAELLAKTQGAFVQRVEVDQRTAGVVLHITRDDAMRVIEATGEVER